MTEQDQVDFIKNFWKRYGNWVLTVFVLIAFAWSGYRYWEHRQDVIQDDNSTMYLSLIQSASEGSQANISAKAHYLMQNSPNSIYAGLGALILASSDVASGNIATAQQDLTWVLDHQKNPDLLSMARLRLARISLEQGEPADAIKLLSPVPAAYAMSFNMVLGDADVMLGQIDQAKAAYQLALDSASKDNKNSAMKNLIEIKLANLPEASV